jgi:hypothetical protein
MSQRSGTHDRRTTSDDEDIDELRGRQAGRSQETRPHYPVGQPAGDDDVHPDEPCEPAEPEPAEPEADEFELAGDNDLGAADLGPLAPVFADPDAPSGRTKKITRRPSA